jgi:flagellar hook-associated protein 3 FlgL
MAVGRIGTGANAQLMIAQIQKAQFALDVSSRQVITGKVSDNYTGFGDKTAVLESARSSAARADANVAVAQQASIRLDLQDAQLSQLATLMGEVRQTLTKAAADQDTSSMVDQLEGLFSQAVEILNAKDSNGFLYGGDNNQTPPVTIGTLAELAALPSVSDAFANGSIKTSVRLGDNQTIELGILAEDLGTQMFALLRQVAQFDAGPDGPLTGSTTSVQQNFLESSIPSSIAAFEGANQAVAANGIRYQSLQNSLARLEASTTIHKVFVSNIEDVDITKALTDLNQNKVALEATFQISSTLNRLSLLNFL